MEELRLVEVAIFVKELVLTSDIVTHEDSGVKLRNAGDNPYPVEYHL